MEKQIRKIINEVYSDLAAALSECGETMDGESLADTVGDRMHDAFPEYSTLTYEKRRSLVLRICNEYC